MNIFGMGTDIVKNNRIKNLSIIKSLLKEYSINQKLKM